MKVLLLADANSVHTRRWATALAEAGITVAIFSFIAPADPLPAPGEILHFGSKKGDRGLSGSGLIRKSAYLGKIPLLRRCIHDFSPDIVHAHYASSYGLLGALSGFHPFVISLWGSDVYDFPLRSFLSEKILRFNLRKADKILSTSRTMAAEAGKYTSKEIRVVPFGIDTEVFRPSGKGPGPEGQELVIGTVKALEPVYGIDVLLKAFSLLADRHPEIPLRLVIAGDGSMEDGLRKMAAELNIDSRVTFTGRVPHEKVPGLLNTFDIFAALSHRESFGVSLLEASSSGLPVVATDIAGFREVVRDNVTGILIPPGDPGAAESALSTLATDAGLRETLGHNGRHHVLQSFRWKACVEQMQEVYREMMAGK